MIEFTKFILSGIAAVNEAEMCVKFAFAATNSFEAKKEKLNY